ncbi:amino acid transporter [Elysia marginata]|uniref:Amino acid transporter n=1 Tax=Elysia marginata TaxID=1093978 RepID=A0AAV4FFX7_9GAST|nr:amino acid transporter [Elysia marginata]
MESDGTMDPVLENGHSQAEESGQVKHSPRFRKFLQDHLYLICNIVGIIVGFLIGLLARSQGLGEQGILWLGLPGELYIRVLKCIIVPLIVCSVIDGTANTDPRTNGQLGLVSLTYMIISNSIGACLGLVWCLIFKPGKSL